MIIPLTKKETLSQLRAVVNKIRTNKDIYILSDILEGEKTDTRTLVYSAGLWIEDQKTKEKTKKDIAVLLNKINDILEGRLLKLGLENKINSTLSQFTLKNLYGWKDKQEIENKNINVELNNLLDEVITSNNGLIDARLPEPKAVKVEIKPPVKTRGKGKKTKAKPVAINPNSVVRVAPHRAGHTAKR